VPPNISLRHVLDYQILSCWITTITTTGSTGLVASRTGSEVEEGLIEPDVICYKD
jgi:hypothetical protein